MYFVEYACIEVITTNLPATSIWLRQISLNQPFVSIWYKFMMNPG